MTDSLLEVAGVSTGYGLGDVLHDVDLAVDGGELVAILGPNGAGKSTLLRVIAGFLPPRTGTVRLRGIGVAGAAPSELARCGVYLLPEGRAVFPNLTVTENLRVATARPERGDVATQRRRDALAAFPRLADRPQQLAGTMSGGEQRMLALARAFTANPLLLLLDEPSLGLAPRIVDEVFAGIERFRAVGTAVVLVEQYVHRSLAVADRAVVLDRGAVVHSGPARQLDADDLARRYLG
ncbi:MAG TPA: ABC transporter ATP-binding protein [Acidimicrobiales bacterium]|nr:ABC transporter ATP-binding protein [Acidimicrobiales bacterium]